jgi:GINS complex subunit 4
MDLDDDDSFFTRNILGGNPTSRQRQPAPPPAARAPQRRPSPNPFQSDPDFDVWATNRDSEDTEEETPLQQLIRHWMNERHAPDILPVQQALLSGLLDHIRRQVRNSSGVVTMT